MVPTPVLIYIKKAATLDPVSLLFEDQNGERHAVGVDILRPDELNGDGIGVVWSRGMHLRKILATDPNIVVMPPFHRPLTADQVPLFAYAGAKVGDNPYDVLEMLFKRHKMHWMHPEHDPFS